MYLGLRWWRGKPVFGVFHERMGFVPKAPQGKKIIWIHAVSVGEVLATQELVVKIKQHDPTTWVYLTTGTPGGKKMACEYLSADTVSFLPFDFLPFVLLGFSRIKPAKLIIIEAELWPNLLMVAALKRIPAYLVNARIIQSSAYKNSFRKALVVPMLRTFKHIYAQTAQEKEAFESVGVDAGRVSDLGNIKAFNVLVKKNALTLAVRPDGATRVEGSDGGLTLLVGSLHQPELILYLDLFKALKPTFPTLKLILAPRHFHWQGALVQAIKKLGVSYVLVDNPTIPVTQELLDKNDIVLICTIGKLFEVYPLADLFFLGGTFVPIGGHNLLEPAMWGNPTIVGPYYHNSQVIADELEQVGGLVKVMSPEKLIETVTALLKDPRALAKRGACAGLWLEQAAKQVEQHVDEFVRGL